MISCPYRQAAIQGVRVDMDRSFYHFDGMTYTIGMDSAGRLVLPKIIRERYGLADGRHEMELVDTPDGILLRPRAEFIKAERTAGGWVVFQAAEPDRESVDPVAAIESERDRRHRHVMGEE